MDAARKKTRSLMSGSLLKLRITGPSFGEARGSINVAVFTNAGGGVSSLARILGECLTIYSRPAFLFCFLSGD